MLGGAGHFRWRYYAVLLCQLFFLQLKLSRNFTLSLAHQRATGNDRTVRGRIEDARGERESIIRSSLPYRTVQADASSQRRDPKRSARHAKARVKDRARSSIAHCVMGMGGWRHLKHRNLNLLKSLLR